MAKKAKISAKHQVWIDVRKRYHLSHAHIQMARQLGLNPKKFGKIANYKQEPWKAGDVLVQKDLAWTLQQISDRAAAGFYGGEVARRGQPEARNPAGDERLGLVELHGSAPFRARLGPHQLFEFQ